MVHSLLNNLKQSKVRKVYRGPYQLHAPCYLSFVSHCHTFVLLQSILQAGSLHLPGLPLDAVFELQALRLVFLCFPLGTPVFQ